MRDNIIVTGGTLSESEIKAYVDYVHEKNPHQQLRSMTIQVDGDFVNLSYQMQPIPFERIRRITGYLVGTTDRFNNAKRAEERDRVKHGVGASFEPERI